MWDEISNLTMNEQSKCWIYLVITIDWRGVQEYWDNKEDEKLKALALSNRI